MLVFSDDSTVCKFFIIVIIIITFDFLVIFWILIDELLVSVAFLTFS